MPDSEDENMMADGTNHLTSHDDKDDDEGQRQKAEEGEER